VFTPPKVYRGSKRQAFQYYLDHGITLQFKQESLEKLKGNDLYLPILIVFYLGRRHGYNLETAIFAVLADLPAK
jgi:hypothetical protein